MPDLLNSLKLRILGGVFLTFLLAMGMIFYGVWTYQRDRLIEQTSRNAKHAGLLITAGLRSSMLLNDRTATTETINTMLNLEGFSLITVVNLQSRVIMSSNPVLIGTRPDRMKEPGCLACHAGSPAILPPTAIINSDHGAFIRNVTAIRNETACHSCHDANDRIIGIMVIDSSLEEMYALLAGLAQRIVLTGSGAFLLCALLLHFILSRFFTRPMDELLVGFEQVGRGDFTYWVEVKCGGEIGLMADSFNIMSRAISRYVDEVRKGRKEVEAHYTIVEALSHTIEKKKLKEVVVDLLGKILSAETVSLALPVENKDGIFEIVSIHRGDKRHYHMFFDLHSDRLHESALTMQDIERLTDQDSSRPAVFSLNGRKLLIPIQQKNMKIGLVGIVKPPRESFTRSEMKIIPVLSHHIIVSFANARLYSMAVTDGLTLLYTKRYFQLKIQEFIDSFHADRIGFWVLLLDLDHFKEVNDSYGHPVGDLVLMRIAELIRENVRHGDIPCRYGGEEFIVLLKGERQEDAIKAAERVRTVVAEHIFSIDSIPPFSKTISAGLACFPHHFSTAEQVVAAADSALYKAKKNGRNRIEVFEG